MKPLILLLMLNLALLLSNQASFYLIITECLKGVHLILDVLYFWLLQREFYMIVPFIDTILKSEGKHYLVTIRDTANKLTRIVFAVMRNNKSYVPIY